MGRAPGLDGAIADSTRFLSTPEALASIAVDPYWPKWDSPWWHALALFEIGEARRIPEVAIRALVARVDAMPLHHFPIGPDDAPAGTRMWADFLCHCALGSIVQMGVACGLDMPRELPWIDAWFDRYQMADGGYTCDNDAYLVTHECGSSMVGTVPMLEALVALGRTGDTARRAAQFLIDRECRLGSTTTVNAEERDIAPKWPRPTFPRFYFYDTLRGLEALVAYARATSTTIPAHAVRHVVDEITAMFPDGNVRVLRNAFTVHGSRDPHTGERTPAPAPMFALQRAIAERGAVSPYLTERWARVRAALAECQA